MGNDLELKDESDVSRFNWEDGDIIIINPATKSASEPRHAIIGRHREPHARALRVAIGGVLDTLKIEALARAKTVDHKADKLIDKHQAAVLIAGAMQPILQKSLAAAAGKNRRASRKAQDIPVSVKVLIVKDDRIIILKDARSPFWDLPGGHVHEGETIEDALTREVAEETGLRFKNPREIDSFEAVLGDEDKFVMIFNAEYAGGTEKLSSEHTAFKWIFPSEATGFNLGSFQRLFETGAQKAVLDYVLSKPALDWLISHIGWAAEQISEDLATELETLLGNAFTGGQSIPQIRDEIVKLISDDGSAIFSDVRAARIAETEVMSSYREGDLESFRDGGYVNEVELDPSPDACEECLAFKGLKFTLEEAEGLDGPHHGTWVNCRCLWKASE